MIDRPPASPAGRTASRLLGIPALACVAFLIATAGFLAWSSSRGLDITDEGFYLLSARYPADVLMTTSSAAMLTAPYRLLRWNIAAFRIAGLAGTLLAGALLFAGLHAIRARLATRPRVRGWPETVAEASAIIIATLLGHSWLLTTPSYNSVTAWGLHAGAGAVLMALACHERTPRAADRWMAFAGAGLGFVFFAKFPAAVSAAALFTIVILLWPLAVPRVRVRWLSAAALGAALSVTVYFVFLQSLPAWLAMFRGGLWAAATLSPLFGSNAFARYFSNWRDDVVVEILKGEWPLLLGLAAIAAVLRMTTRGRQPGGRSVQTIVWLALGYAAYAAGTHLWEYPPSLYVHDVVRYFFRWLLVLALPALAWRGLREDGSAPTPGCRLAWALIALLLLALPFCGAIGTSNPIQFGMRYTLAPWFGLFALLLGLLSTAGRTRWPAPVGLACLSASCAFYVVEGSLYAPYRLVTPLRQQTHVTAVGVPPTALRLDAELSTFITDLRRVAAESGFKPGDEVLAFYDMPGIVSALGGRSPGIAWYTIGHPGAQIVAERSLALIGPARASQAYLLQTASSTAWLQTLGGYGIHFPQDYVLGGTLTIPFSWKHEDVKWWRPRRK